MRTVLLSCAVAVLTSLSACCQFNGNSVCRYECKTTADCPAGKVCVHEQAHNADTNDCLVPCTRNDAGVPSYQCPDSPDGTACKTDDGKPFCPP